VTSVTAVEPDLLVVSAVDAPGIDQREAMNNCADPATRMAKPHARARKINFRVLINAKGSGRGNAGSRQAELRRPQRSLSD